MKYLILLTLLFGCSERLKAGVCVMDRHTGITYQVKKVGETSYILSSTKGDYYLIPMGVEDQLVRVDCFDLFDKVGQK